MLLLLCCICVGGWVGGWVWVWEWEREALLLLLPCFASTSAAAFLCLTHSRCVVVVLLCCCVVVLFVCLLACFIVRMHHPCVSQHHNTTQRRCRTHRPCFVATVTTTNATKSSARKFIELQYIAAWHNKPLVRRPPDKHGMNGCHTDKCCWRSRFHVWQNWNW